MALEEIGVNARTLAQTEIEDLFRELQLPLDVNFRDVLVAKIMRFYSQGGVDALDRLLTKMDNRG